MNFFDFEEKMNELGFSSLASIARALESTPQAVSNWKARDQVPHHIVLTINEWNNKEKQTQENKIFSNTIYNEEKISFPDLFNVVAEQLKVIILLPFIFVFLTFIFVQFIQEPKYTSYATVLVPENQVGSAGGIAGLASQFGVNIPTGVQADLSSPAILPDLLYSRTFGEKILYKKIYSKAHDAKVPIFSLFYFDFDPNSKPSNLKKSKALRSLRKMIDYNQSIDNPVSTLSVTALDPNIAKDLADIVLTQLDSLNRFYKNQVANEKITFIESRILSVMKDFEESEQFLKDFNQNNRQISSPSLQLQLDRLQRDVEIQKGIYLTLKQQLELAKIEKIQETSVIQIIDVPQIPTSKNSKNLIIKVFLSAILGLTIGIMIGLIRSNAKNASIKDRKKIRKFKFLLKKKSLEFFKDPQISGILSCLFLIGMPFFLDHESKNPTFFGKYSSTALIINLIYILITLLFIFLFLLHRNKSNQANK